MGLITERCRECDSAHFKYRCDFNDCNKVSNDESPVQLDFGYGSKRDTENWYFCSDECFERWLIEWFLQDKVIRKEDAPDTAKEDPDINEFCESMKGYDGPGAREDPEKQTAVLTFKSKTGEVKDFTFSIPADNDWDDVIEELGKEDPVKKSDYEHPDCENFLGQKEFNTCKVVGGHSCYRVQKDGECPKGKTLEDHEIQVTITCPSCGIVSDAKDYVCKDLDDCDNYHCPNCCHTFKRDFSDFGKEKEDPVKSCEWKYDNYQYNTSCGTSIGELFYSSRMKFCPYCGKEIKVVE